MPRIDEIKEAGYRIIRKKPKIEYKELEEIKPNQNHTVIRDPKTLPTIGDHNNYDFLFNYEPVKNIKLPPVIHQIDKNFLVKQQEDTNKYNDIDTKQFIIPQQENLNEGIVLNQDLRKIQEDLNKQEIPEGYIRPIKTDLNPGINPNEYIRLIKEDLNKNKNFTKDVVPTVENLNKNKILDKDIVPIVENKHLPLDTSREPVPIAPGTKGTIEDLGYVKQIADGPNKPWGITSDQANPNPPGYQFGIAKDQSTGILPPRTKPNVPPPPGSLEGALASIRNEWESFTNKFTPEHWAKKWNEMVDKATKNLITKAEVTAKTTIRAVENLIMATPERIMDAIANNPWGAITDPYGTFAPIIIQGAMELENKVNQVTGQIDAVTGKINDTIGFINKTTGSNIDELGYIGKVSFFGKNRGKKKPDPADRLGPDVPFETKFDMAPFFTTSKDTTTFLGEPINTKILDETGKPIPDPRNKLKSEIQRDGSIVEKGVVLSAYHGHREGPFHGAFDAIYKNSKSFQSVPDIFYDIEIKPYEYLVNTDKGQKVYAPPAYPYSKLGGYMINDFNVKDISMNVSEAWDLGVYGQLPTSISVIMPSAMSIIFVSDADLHTHKWILATNEYMKGSLIDPTAMRPFKMCCHRITVYATTFYGECLYARTYIAYMTNSFEHSMRGTGGVKMFETEWHIVGMLNYTKPQPDLVKFPPPPPPEKIDSLNAVMGESDNGASAFLANNSADKELEGSIGSHIDSAIDKAGEAYNALPDSIKNAIPLNVWLDKEAKYIVFSFTNFVAQPMYSENKVRFDSVARNDAATMQNRFKVNDELALKRAAEYVMQMSQTKKIPPDNIKVIIGSQDGVPNGNDIGILPITEFNPCPVTDKNWYLGGLCNYSNEDATTSSATAPLAGLSKNRRTDLINFQKLMQNPNQKRKFCELLKISDTTNMTDTMIWNKVPKIEFGRNMRPAGYKALDAKSLFSLRDVLGSKSLSSFYEKSEDKSILANFRRGYISNAPEPDKKIKPKGRTLLNNNNTIKTTIQKKPEPVDTLIEKYQTEVLEIRQQIEVNGESKQLINDYLYNLDKVEQYKYKINTGIKGVELFKTYRLELITKHELVSENKVSWWKKTFGDFKLQIKDKTITTVENVELDTYAHKLPQSAKNKPDVMYPVLNLNIYNEELFKQDKKLIYLFDVYFTKHNICWIYNIYDDSLMLYYKRKI